ncbi:MAG: SAM-dependent methyltransferase [Clostridia bacterium]|nr:SAM-dependent methyltransferase [Clostridia bacterium]
MDGRLDLLFGLVSRGETFADIGCDHGYIAERVLKENKFEKVIVSDISSKSLQKAVDLLKPYGDRVKAIVSDGFENFDILPDEVMIAGMGGEEIIKILSNAPCLPKRLVLAPQKNTDKLRRFLVSIGYKILKDFTFKDRCKFYDAIVAEEGVDEYLETEYLYGRDNLKDFPDAFKEKLLIEAKMLEDIIALNSASKSSKEDAKIRLENIRKILK